MEQGTVRRLLIGKGSEQSRRFLSFIAVVATIGAILHAVLLLYELQAPLGSIVYGGIVVVALVAATFSGYSNDAILFGGFGLLVLLTAVFLTGEIVLAIQQASRESRAIPMYLSFASVALVVGIAASSLGAVLNRVTSTFGRREAK